jgi:hypothetical protein
MTKIKTDLAVSGEAVSSVGHYSRECRSSQVRLVEGDAGKTISVQVNPLRRGRSGYNVPSQGPLAELGEDKIRL